MAVSRSIGHVTGGISSVCRLSSVSGVVVCVILMISVTDVIDANGEFCSLFIAQCVRQCDVKDTVHVTYPSSHRSITVNAHLCDPPLVCCFISQRQSDRGLAIPDLTGGQIPYHKQRYRPQRPFVQASPTPPPTPLPSTSSSPSPSPVSEHFTDIYGNPIVPPSNVCGVRGHSRVKRIVNGVKVERCRYPWMVLLDRGPNPWDTCGASLISDRHIITAAHCFQYIPGRPVVVVGEYDKKEIRPGSEVRISDYNITIHPYYDSVQFVNDIAMITLATPLDLSKYECLRPICLPDKDEDIPVGTNCLVMGWGSVQRDNEFSIPRTSNILQEATIQVVRSSLCDKMWADRYHPGVHICAGDMAGHTDSCLGDSGGPLMCPSPSDKDVFYLHGVVSLGSTTCAAPNVPALYTNVGKYRSWINSLMNG